MKMLLLTAALVACVAAPLMAQVALDADPGRSERTREDLEELLRYYRESLQSPAYSAAVKEQLRSRALQIEMRLSEGDFRAGDRIVIRVEGEPSLPDTVLVEAGPMVNLPLFGDISLKGVLRSEVTAHMTEELRRFIRNPIVRAQGLMRVSILGAVTNPGFYTMPADMLLSDALMVAGGPAANARVDQLRVERGRDILLEGDELQDLIREGMTLDQLNLRAGDQVVMPERGGSFLTNIGVITGIVASIGLLVFQLSR